MLVLIKKFFYYLIFEPSKIYNFFMKKYFYVPSIIDLDKLDLHKKLKKINYWNSICKKNPSIKNFFFDDHEKIENFRFESKDLNLNSDKLFKSLASNGIIIINNVLDNNELTHIQKTFTNLKDNNNQYINQIKLTKSDSKKRIYLKKRVNYKNLDSIIGLITKNIFGKKMNYESEFFIDQSLKIPEQKVEGDNVLHTDRFIPNVKIIFSPFSINKNGSPFSYVLRSHKITNKYVDEIANGFHKDHEYLFKQYSKKIVKLDVNENSLIVALTNGYHARAPFEEIGQRSLLFFQFMNSYNKFFIFKYFFK